MMDFKGMSDYFTGKKRWILIVLFSLALAVVVLPVIFSCGYTYLCEDDFSFEAGARDLVLRYGNIYIGAAHRMVEYYDTNQGTFLFNYLMSALMMYTRGGLPLFHIFMMLVTTAFCLSLFNLIRIIAKDITASLGIFLALSVTFFGMANTYAGREIFQWYTGMLNFLIELTLSFIAVSFSISYIRYGKIKHAVMGMIIGFFASGGALNVTASNVGWQLAVLILACPVLKEKKGAVMTFAGSLAGAILNAVAPGNFNRLDNQVAPLYVGFKHTLFSVLSDDKILLSSHVFRAAMMVIFFVCIIMKIEVIKGKVSGVMMMIVLAGTCLVRYFTMFPLAYSNEVYDIMSLNMRMIASYEIVAKLSYALLVAVFAQWIREHFEKKADYAAFAALAIGLLALIITWPATKAEVKDGMSFSLASDFADGSMKESYTAREYIISSLELAEAGTDATIYVPEFKFAESMYGMGLGEDCNEFVNRSAAGLFRLNSVSVIYED